MIDNPEDVQLVKNALKELEGLRTSMEDNDDWDGTYSDFINAAGGNLKKLIYKIFHFSSICQHFPTCSDSFCHFFINLNSFRPFQIVQDTF